MHACVHVCMCACVHVCLYICKYVCMHVYLYVCIACIVYLGVFVCVSSSCKETEKIKCCILFDPILYIIITTLSRYMRAGNLGASAG